MEITTKPEGSPGNDTTTIGDGIDQDTPSIAEVTLEGEESEPDDHNVMQYAQLHRRHRKPRRPKGTICIRLEQLRVDCDHQGKSVQLTPEESHSYLGWANTLVTMTKCNNCRFRACIAKQKLKDIVCHLRKKGIVAASPPSLVAIG